MKIYKVYVIKARETDVIKYVGMTCQTLHKRFMQHVKKRRIDPKDYFIQPVEMDLTLPQAATLEEMLILQYGTRITGWNKAPFNPSGYSHRHSQERKEQWSMERKGRPFLHRQNRTAPNSTEHNEKISVANSKAIICLNDGRTYKSIREASKKLGLSESKVSLAVNGRRSHTKGYKFKYL